jgi:hypothetical protein
MGPRGLAGPRPTAYALTRGPRPAGIPRAAETPRSAAGPLPTPLGAGAPRTAYPLPAGAPRAGYPLPVGVPRTHGYSGPISPPLGLG